MSSYIGSVSVAAGVSKDALAAGVRGEEVPRNPVVSSYFRLLNNPSAPTHCGDNCGLFVTPLACVCVEQDNYDSKFLYMASSRWRTEEVNDDDDVRFELATTVD